MTCILSLNSEYYSSISVIPIRALQPTSMSLCQARSSSLFLNPMQSILFVTERFVAFLRVGGFYLGFTNRSINN